MDENYLDSLLETVSTEKSKPNNSFDNNVEEDSGIDIDMSDLDNISLDELDDLDSLDLGDLEFDDIDFDDVDITNLDSGHVTDNLVKSSDNEEDDFSLDALISEAEENSVAVSEEQEEENHELPEEPADDVFSDADMQYTEDTVNTSAVEENDIQSMDLDDLFSALGIEDDNDSQENTSYTSDEEGLDELLQASMALGAENGDLAEIDDIEEKAKPAKKSGLRKSGLKKSDGESRTKKNLSEILFGEPDEDDIEEEKLLVAKKAEKQIKKEEKKAAREAKNASQKEQQALKQREEQRKKKEKAEALKSEREAELEAEKNDKRVSTPTVVIVFVAFTALLMLVVFGARQFNYSQVIRKASDYFERQRYRLAYDEVSGVEVKEKDEDLRDRIYTVMYVERLYESYENNMALNRPDKALDALLRGLEKYDEHYEEAVELKVTSDINSCKDKIINALWNTYSLSENQAYDIMELTGQEYTQTLIKYCEGLQTGE